MIDKKYITGIQQIGVGVEDVDKAFKWYNQNFGMDVVAFREKAVAQLMLPYTGGEKRERYAMLALNMQGGGGFEIWQHTGKKPQPWSNAPKLGDLGIFIVKMKTSQIDLAYSDFQKKNLNLISEILISPSGQKHFFVQDPYGNIFQFIDQREVFYKTETYNGGVAGAIIGVSDMQKALTIYQDILEYDQIVYDETAVFADLTPLKGSEHKVRRVLLKHSQPRTGSFAPMLGPTSIELVQLIDTTGTPIFGGRMWGDPGFIHLCFDVIGIDPLRKEVKSKGFPFTVDSAESFDMGEAAGHFAYISDPDNTPIEFVETHRLPIIKKIGWNMNLKGRSPKKSLPIWMIKTLRWKREKV
ncbi:MAG: VOC family protein [Bacteroidales bacterium]|nr:VOC family protein [Bacteroidales bacterium]